LSQVLLPSLDTRGTLQRGKTVDRDSLHHFMYGSFR
jgi:hypothetical protein